MVAPNRETIPFNIRATSKLTLITTTREYTYCFLISMICSLFTNATIGHVRYINIRHGALPDKDQVALPRQLNG